MARAVRILFPDLTHHGKIYSAGEIEPNPTEYLLEAARTKETIFHRGNGRQMRLCRFVTAEDEDMPSVDEERIIRTPIVSQTFSDDLDDLGLIEMQTLAISLGLKRQVARDVKDKQKLRFIITALRKL
jgi:hypothetical protein